MSNNVALDLKSLLRYTTQYAAAAGYWFTVATQMFWGRLRTGTVLPFLSFALNPCTESIR